MEKLDIEVIKIEDLGDGMVMKYYWEWKICEGVDGEIIIQYIQMILGWIIYNKTIVEVLVF